MWRNARKRAAEIAALAEGSVVACFDTETTGLDMEKAKIIQFSGMQCRYEDGNFVPVEGSEIDMYINPVEQLDPKITEITGITQEMVDTASPESACFDEIARFLDTDAWAAYNASFDVKMIHLMCERLHRYMHEPNVLDILEWSRDILAPDEVDNYKLSSVFEVLEPDAKEKRFHDSMEDVRAMVAVMQDLAEYYSDLPEEEPKRLVHLEKASLYFDRYKNRWNPKNATRIRLVLSEGQKGDIFYDIYHHYWNAKADKKAKRLFESIDMSDLEEQFLVRYAYRYGMKTVDEVAQSWLDYREKLISENVKKADGK